jgi:PPOX class probable FMN-dependent enzyme
MNDAARGLGFQQVVSSSDELEAVLGRPSERVLAKVTGSLDGICRDFISRSPFMLIASSDGDGNFDVSPKGDPPGFVQVLDSHTLAIPERPGNKRADTFRNILRNPQVGLIFLVPGKRETLRVSGDALIVRDPELREGMTLAGKVPDLALVVSVREAFMHCAKCMVRSHLWEPASWPSLDGLPSLAEAMIAHGRLDTPVSELQARIDDDARNRLY